MLHIYRQITSLRRVRPVVIARKRENRDCFPFEPVHVVNKPSWHFLRRFWFKQLRDRPWEISRSETAKLQRILEQTNARLLHIYFGHIAIHLLPLIRRWNKPSIVSFHGADVLVDMQKPAYRAAVRAMLNSVHRVLVRSDSLRRAVIDLGCAPEKIALQRTGIPVAEFPFQQRRAPVAGEWRLLQSGRLIEKKGLTTTLRAFAQFHAAYPRSTLIVAGEGAQLAELQKLAAQLGIAASVSFPGFVSQEKLRALLYSSHLFLHPSEVGHDGNQEGVPNSILEAMATGLPIFATRHGGIPEAVEDGKGGMLVKERDHDSLANVLIGAARDPARLAMMSHAAAKSAAANYGQTEQTRRLEEFYLREIGGQPRN
jgi:Glycosyltransferase